MDSDDEYGIESGHDFFNYMMMMNCDDYFGDIDYSDYGFNGSDLYDDEDDDDDGDPDDNDPFTLMPPASELKTMKRCQSMYSKLNQNRKESLFCDATISVEGKKYPVHKTVLTAASSYFYTMFTGSFTEKNEDCIEIRGVSEAVFNNLLDYIYGEELKLSFENIRELYVAADMLCIDGLIKDCKQFFQDNWLFATDINAVYEMAQEFDFQGIVKKIITSAQNCLHNFSIRADYKELPYEFICKVLEDRSVVNHLNKEWSMTESLVNWAVHKPQERLPETALELLSKIRLELVPESHFNEILEKSCKSDECAKADASIVQAFKHGMQSLYEKSHALIADHNLELVALDASHDVEFCNVLVFDSATWKWASKSYPVGFKPESALVNGDNFYVCGTEGGCMLNTRTGVSVKLPSFPMQRTKFTFAVANSSVYLFGGVQNDTKRRQAEVLELRPNCSFWSRRMTWRKSKCSASTIVVNKFIYIVGGAHANSNPTNENAEFFVYNSISNYFRKIGEFSYPMQRPKLVVFDDVLYVFTSRFDIVERIDIKMQKRLETIHVVHPLYPCVVLDVFAVREGIIGAFVHEDQIILGLVKPSENMKFEILGFVPKPNFNIELGYKKDHFTYLRKRLTT